MVKKLFLLSTILIITPSLWPTESICYLFSHGLGCNASQAQYYEEIGEKKWIIQPPYITFNFPDATSDGSFDRSKTSLGQENEILALTNAFAHALAHHTKVILVGMSRGAATILNWLGTARPTNVVAAVVESPFDSILSIIHTRLAAEQVSWLPRFIAETSPNVLFGQFNRNGIFPIKVAEYIPRDIPLLLISSLEDTVVPPLNTANIYLALHDTDHPHSYLLLMNKGAHATLLWEEEGLWYLHTVHAFYKKYGLPHDPYYAQQGEYLLAQCQPSKEMVEQAIAKNRSYIQVPVEDRALA